MQNDSLDQDHQDTFAHSNEIPRWSAIVCAIYVIVVIIAGLPGNTLVIIVQSKLKQKSSTDWFVLGLAVCDVTSLAFNLPIYFLGFTSLWKFVATSVGCKLHTFIHFQTYVASAFFFTLIAGDRYTKICRPHAVIFTPRRGKLASIVVLVVSSLMNAHHYFISGLDASGRCVFDRNKTIISGVGYIVGSILLVTTTLFIYYAYVMVYRRMRRLRRTVPSVFYLNLKTKDTSAITTKKPESTSLNKNSETAMTLKLSLSHTDTKLEGSRETTKAIVSSETCEGVTDTSINKTNFVIDTGENTGSSRMSPAIIPNPQDSDTDEAIVNTTRLCGHRQKETHDNTSVENVKNISEGKQDTRQESRMFTTTNAMAVASILYMTCTTIPSIASAIWTNTYTEMDAAAFLFLRLLYCINLSINPYFYIGLSSRFRKKALEALNSLR